MEMIELDGAHGGGQLLRTALSLSLCTGVGFTMQQIRAQRSRPGLMRQHLTAVAAAAEIGHARVHGAGLGATSLRFEPGAVEPGDYHFATGTAGSTTLVLQTVLPALWRCNAPSRLRLEGGTHNPLAPSADFIIDSYLPVLRQLGVDTSLAIECHGFYPAGGGAINAMVEPCAQLRHCALNDRGALQSVEATALMSALSTGIGRRELAVLAEQLGLGDDALHMHSVKPAIGPGNALLVRVRHAAHVETFTGYGERGVSAEAVAQRLATEVRTYLKSSACVGEHLADQLLLPMALAGGGMFTTTAPTEHLRSNAALIEKFLAVEIGWKVATHNCWSVTVSR
ncbi:MAG TPA: RNA 3'-terminal phosphate cyclase [Xanthomonadaceae bacterium]|nr:RNA 3'-terminal phosphate cyclase [Xanthomonadaceae bacterium]